MAMKNQLQKDVQNFLKPFIEMSSLSGVQFPLLRTTYSLWRKVCYKQIVQKYGFDKNSQEDRQLKRAFIQISERKLLPQFLVKVNQQIDGKSVGWRRAILQADELKSINSPYYNELLFQYCELLYQLQLYIQLFYDLVSIPYTEIYSDSKQYLLNEKYKTSFYSQKNQTLVDKACQKIGKNIISKGLGKLSETLLSNRFIYSVTGILSTFNPLAFAASMSISYAMQQHQKTSKQKAIIAQLQFLKNMMQKNLIDLKQTYEQCLNSIQTMASIQHNEKQLLERQKKKFFEILANVLTQDWLEIKITKQGQWEFVELNNKFTIIHEFQDIHLTKSQQEKD